MRRPKSAPSNNSLTSLKPSGPTANSAVPGLTAAQAAELAELESDEIMGPLYAYRAKVSALCGFDVNRVADYMNARAAKYIRRYGLKEVPAPRSEAVRPRKSAK